MQKKNISIKKDISYIFIKNIIEKFKTRYAGENWIKSLFSSESWQ